MTRVLGILQPTYQFIILFYNAKFQGRGCRFPLIRVIALRVYGYVPSAELFRETSKEVSPCFSFRERTFVIEN